MSYFLFLDDYRNPKDVNWVHIPDAGWNIVRNFEQFTEAIFTLGIPNMVSYDCDLADEHYKAYFNLGTEYVNHYQEFKTKCGIHCLDFLLDVCKRRSLYHPPFIIHSKNHYVHTHMIHKIWQHNQDKHFNSK
jgi:hypothetical protein